MAHLEAKVGIGVAVVEVAPFGAFEEFDKDFLIIPGGCGDVGIGFFPSLELGVFFFSGGGGVVAVVAHEKFYDLFGLPLKALDVKVDFGADGVFGGLVKRGGVGVGVVHGAAVTAGDDNFLAGLGLQVIEEVEQYGVDEFLAVA